MSLFNSSSGRHLLATKIEWFLLGYTKVKLPFNRFCAINGVWENVLVGVLLGLHDVLTIL